MNSSVPPDSTVIVGLCTRVFDPLNAVPPSVIEPAITSVRVFIDGALVTVAVAVDARRVLPLPVIDPPLQANGPLMTTSPAPVRVPPVMTTVVVPPKNAALSTVNAAPLAISNRGELVAPTVMNATVLADAMLIVSVSAMTTLSVETGRRFKFQFPAVPQLLFTAPVHWMVGSVAHPVIRAPPLSSTNPLWVAGVGLTTFTVN